ncbi:proheparin-binding EGF-like growth factor [Brienomyrus brachyistius]|uniref:proheparin-binding EGF-like growth factor n=1 Tax=Brienomyrus brachyistius TaxID=42636 RepID=UPI0020B32387|nr:proheparin-binding EGF-like growth factor [Brienomyrus brachyistius]
MELLKVLLLFVLCFVMVLLASCASVGTHDAEKPAETAVINLIPSNEGRREDDRGEVPFEHFEEYDENLSGYYEAELPKVAFSIKPKDLAGVPNKDGKKKGKGRKRNPCRRKYKDFCIHGVCQYLEELRSVSCICTAGYSGERCHLFSLPVGTEKSGYNRTTALAVMAVVLSSLCLIVIGILLALRYHKRGGYNVESEEKVKLGLASHK